MVLYFGIYLLAVGAFLMYQIVCESRELLHALEEKLEIRISDGMMWTIEIELLWRRYKKEYGCDELCKRHKRNIILWFSTGMLLFGPGFLMVVGALLEKK